MSVKGGEKILVERKKSIVPNEEGSERKYMVYPDGTQIHNEIIDKAHKKAPNTMKYGIAGLILGAALGGPWGALVLGGLGTLYGVSQDEEI